MLFTLTFLFSIILLIHEFSYLRVLLFDSNFLMFLLNPVISKSKEWIINVHKHGKKSLCYLSHFGQRPVIQTKFRWRGVISIVLGLPRVKNTMNLIHLFLLDLTFYKILSGDYQTRRWLRCLEHGNRKTIYG